MLSYPPEGHKTDSKRIFLIGSAEDSCVVNGQTLKINEFKNFTHLVNLKLGENHINIEIDGVKYDRTVIGVRSDNPAPVAYAKYYDSFPPNQTIKENILKGITVSKNKIEIPLAIAPIYNLEKKSPFNFSLDLSDIKTDLDWIHYLDEKSMIKIIQKDSAKLEINLAKPVRSVEEKWENNNLCLIFRFVEPDFVVCIDAGHGGSHIGTISPKGIFEKDLNLSFALKLAKEFEALGVEYYLTRNDDRNLSLQERVKISKQNKCTFFISLHHNALPDSRDPSLERGFSCHYYKDHSRKFAQYINSKLNEFSGISSAGIYRQNLHVLRENTDAFALLLEMGFLIHPEESEIITNPEFQDKNSKVLAKAIYNFNKELNCL